MTTDLAERLPTDRRPTSASRRRTALRDPWCPMAQPPRRPEPPRHLPGRAQPGDPHPGGYGAGGDRPSGDPRGHDRRPRAPQGEDPRSEDPRGEDLRGEGLRDEDLRLEDLRAGRLLASDRRATYTTAGAAPDAAQQRPDDLPERHHLAVTSDTAAKSRWDPPLPADGGPPPGPPPEDDDAPPVSWFAPESDAPTSLMMDPRPPLGWTLDTAEAPELDLDRITPCPELAQLLDGLGRIDHLVRSSLMLLHHLEQTDVTATTGLSLTGWLTLVGRRTTADVRMLRTTDRVLTRLPSLKDAFHGRQLSWAQLRSIVLSVERLPAHLDRAIDQAIAESLQRTWGGEPDAVTRHIRWAIAALQPENERETERQATRSQYLGMQPHKDGSGGRFWGEADPTAFAILDAALNHDLPVPPAARTGFAGDPTDDNEQRRNRMRHVGKARLQRLLDILDDHLAGGSGPHGSTGDPTDRRETDAHPRASTTGSDPEPQERRSRSDAAPTTVPRRARPKLLLRTNLSTLLDRDQTPAALLTTLLGGHVRVTADTARDLINQRGADLRTVIIDDHGRVVGVGRQQRLAPGWLRDAVLALHDTCAAPTCETAARRCHLDHAQPWHPVDPDVPAGRTDLDQLAPLCARDNTAKEPEGWTAIQQPDGTRTWRHQATSITTRTIPPGWQPSQHQPRDGPRRR